MRTFYLANAGWLVLWISALAFPQGSIKPASVGGVKYASQFNWSQTPAADLSSPGSHTITLTPCPPGFYVNAGDYVPTQYVYISGTGTAEADAATRVSGHAFDATCQFSVTTRNAHSAGYTVGSASGGIKEASEAARASIGYSYTNGGTLVIDAAGAPYNVYAPVHIESSFQNVYYGGGFIRCYVSAANGNAQDDDCLVVGSRASSVTTRNVTLNGLVFQPNSGNAVNYAFDAIHVHAQSTTIHNPHINYGQGGGLNQGSFNAYVSVCDDQAFTLDGLYVLDSFGLRTDKHGVGVYALAQGSNATHYDTGGCFGVGSLKNLNLNMQCQANGVSWFSGNGMALSNSQIQANPQWGINVSNSGGGFNGNAEITSVYSEQSSCPNPDYLAAGATGAAAYATAGILSQGDRIIVNGSTGPTGHIPTFGCAGSSGSNTFYYWTIARQSGAGQGNGSSAPLLMGTTGATCSGAVTGYFPAIPPATSGTIVYDVLRTIAGVYPYQGGCSGGSLAACGSVALNVAQSGNTIESFTDDASVNTTSYAGSAVAFVPYLPFWPGNVVLSANVPSNRTQIPVAQVIGDANFCGGFGIGVVSVNGDQGTSVSGNTIANCALGSLAQGLTNTAVDQATLLPMTKGSFGYANGRKGRLIFPGNDIVSPAGEMEIITLVDASPMATMGTPGHRSAEDANDTAIGIDITGSQLASAAKLAFKAPISISNYIGSNFDGTSWKERLTTSLKTFNVPVSVTDATGKAGFFGCLQGTAQTTTLNTIGFTCPTSVTAYNFVYPGAAASGVMRYTNASNIVTGVFDATVPSVIASGTVALGTSSISSGACASVVTVSATGVATTDVIQLGFNGDPTGVTGYTAAGMLTIIPYPTANNANFKVCNLTAGAITPGAITLNWRVVR